MQLKQCNVRCKLFSQTDVVTVSGVTPLTIIGSGIGVKSISHTMLQVGSVIEIIQSGKMTSGNSTTGTVIFKCNSTGTTGVPATLPNSLSDAGLIAIWNMTVKSIDSTNITFQVAVRSAINSTNFLNVFNRVSCVELVVPISTSYTLDLTYNFNDLNGIIKVGQTIISVMY